ncbi:MAG: hypothetical protein NE327_09260 [Lentisphaeraceae bacterium]|nr:hypothetical protein [Lentisphaeraceae bacterium]
MGNRKVTPIHESFFNDGHWYVLSSSSLGGSGLNGDEIADKLQTQEDSVMNELLSNGVCLPLYFGADCELDNVVFVEGDLNEEEEAEWIGRIRSKLKIPCGELMLMGGGMPEDFEDALPNFEPPNPNFRYFQKLKMTPGAYMVEVYAFLGSYAVNESWEEKDPTEFEKWWDSSRPGEERAEWIEFFKEEEYVDGEDMELQEYIIRIVPLEEDVPLPALDEDYNWVGDFEMRKPKLCPKGLKSSSYRK